MRFLPVPSGTEPRRKVGSIQVLCDVLKMMTKEIIELKHSDKFLYNLAPFMVIIASFLTFSCLPISKGWKCWTSTWVYSSCWRLRASVW